MKTQIEKKNFLRHQKEKGASLEETIRAVSMREHTYKRHPNYNKRIVHRAHSRGEKKHKSRIKGSGGVFYICLVAFHNQEGRRCGSIDVG